MYRCVNVAMTSYSFHYEFSDSKTVGDIRRYLVMWWFHLRVYSSCHSTAEVEFEIACLEVVAIRGTI